MKTKNTTDLLQKYANNQLSVTELTELKNTINSSTDDALEASLLQLWEEETGGQVKLSVLKAIKEVVDINNNRKDWYRHVLIKRVLRVAAMIAIPLFATFMYFLVDRIPAPAVSDMIVSVAAGEQVSITLPDGTKVKLNSETMLNYNVNDFNRKIREIMLSGEAYFEVAENERIPFVIKTKDIEVRVLGTIFNLQARDEELTTELNLIEGKVALSAHATNQQVVVYANQKAILDKRTGEIKVIKDNPAVSTAWLKGELVFHATPIRKVFKEIERNYGIDIQIDENVFLDKDLFTGTFSTENLNETLEILRMHYRFKYTVKGKEVAIEDFRLNKRIN